MDLYLCRECGTVDYPTVKEEDTSIFKYDYYCPVCNSQNLTKTSSDEYCEWCGSWYTVETLIWENGRFFCEKCIKEFREEE